MRPLYSVEIFETESARFETEISEEDVHANWKLKGETLSQSPVSKNSNYRNSNYKSHNCLLFKGLQSGYKNLV